MKIPTDSSQNWINLGDEWVKKNQASNNETTSVTHIEELERHFLEDDLCGNNDDGDSAN